ncbi:MULTISPECIES: alpha/beta hydrolase [unclassified Paenibacillus]|uniref:alpha/beta fold hydrolase n=1 Tax=unclassified Paenibacillus TaxID=185978 RepID=UPI001AEADD99|nr:MULTISPECIES: alpha/beta hydrolase [unclassified Paenibacillus]MBP1156880.1 pimeloyl-ACP methyl ester carboxylesterase [Paenibacillus sp. PvP091]MBP1172381.1 pimeloyl-ACP methyl ester carboxylesterase [Paenibacillus sp. PvR098]MBP2438762.1 pimeloyl-ACP methyl ester carboxylesterase [Paenibacillus sp. PvP052]
MDKRYEDVNGVKLGYFEQGEGTPVVLLHGFCGSSSYWEEVIPMLEGSCQLIVPDLRGHGDSSAPEGTYSMESMAEDIVGLLEKKNCGKAVVLGHSLGGYVTLALAEKHPEKLLGFGLVHSTAYPDDEKGKEGRLKAIDTIKEQGLPVFLEGLIPKLFAPSHVESMPEAVNKAKQIGLGTSPEGAVRTLEGMRTRTDRNDVLSGAKVPVLLLAGAGDQLIAPEKTFSVSGEHIIAKTLEGAGHVSMMETPQELAQAVRDFTAKL